MEAGDQVSAYYDLSRAYWDTAQDAWDKGRVEPALANAYHALELACKAAILAETGSAGHEWRTHNVGGAFGRFYRDRVGPDTSRLINRILERYNFPRYPGQEPPDPRTAGEDLDRIRTVVHDVIPPLLGLNKRPSEEE